MFNDYLYILTINFNLKKKKISLVLFQATARRRKCPDGFWKEDAIIQALMENYTKILPEIEDAVQVDIEIHVQV